MENKNEVTTGTSPALVDENHKIYNDHQTPLKSAVQFIEVAAEYNANILESKGEKCLEVAEKIEKETEKCAVAIEKLPQEVDMVKAEIQDYASFVKQSFNNISKLEKMCQNVYNLAFRYKAYLEADSIIKSTLALALWLYACYVFEIWMIPAIILIIFIKNYIQNHILSIKSKDDNILKDEDNSHSLKQKMEAVKEIMCCVQSILRILDEGLEKVLKIMNVNEPHLFWLGVIIQAVIVLILMFVPINFFFMFWGVSLYLKKFLISNDSIGMPDGKHIDNNIVDATEELGDGVKNAQVAQEHWPNM